MLDIDRLERLRLTPRPLGQRIIGRILGINYNLPPQVRIALENVERLPETPVIYAMNHTDRYNYFPFQYTLWRRCDRFTTTWVKGKYYENDAVGAILEWTNNLPTVSRGYLITRDFIAVTDRPPGQRDYEILRGWVDAAAGNEGVSAPEDIGEVPGEILGRRRNILGYEFDPDRESYADYINGIFSRMMSRFLDLHRQAFDCGLDVLIFPEGTRSLRLSRGHIGISEIALHFDRTIVPVGCSGSDLCHPGAVPIARSGRIVYRIGEPIPSSEVERFRPPGEFTPFDPRAERLHRERFQGMADLIMDRINELVDPPYRFGEDLESEGVQETNRFV